MLIRRGLTFLFVLLVASTQSFAADFSLPPCCERGHASHDMLRASNCDERPCCISSATLPDPGAKWTSQRRATPPKAWPSIIALTTPRQRAAHPAHRVPEARFRGLGVEAPEILLC